MTVPPIPIGPLLPAARFSNRTIFFVIPLEIPAIGMVFVRIPIVIVLVAAVVDAFAFPIPVSLVFFLMSVVLLPCTNC